MELTCLYIANEDLQVKYLVYSLGENLCHLNEGINIHDLQIIEKVNCLSPKTSPKCVDEQTILRRNQGKKEIKITFWFRFTPVRKAVIKKKKTNKKN